MFKSARPASEQVLNERRNGARFHLPISHDTSLYCHALQLFGRVEWWA